MYGGSLDLRQCLTSDAYDEPSPKAHCLDIAYQRNTRCFWGRLQEITNIAVVHQRAYKTKSTTGIFHVIDTIKWEKIQMM
jgi:hypothetical protein